MKYKCIRQLPPKDKKDWGDISEWFTPVGEIEELEQDYEYVNTGMGTGASVPKDVPNEKIVYKINELVREVNELKE